MLCACDSQLIVINEVSSWRDAAIKKMTRYSVIVFLLVCLPCEASGANPFSSLDTRVLDDSQESRETARRMLSNDVRRRIREANLKDVAAWRKVDSRAAWEAFRNERVAKLKRSLGQFPPRPTDLQVKVTGGKTGLGYRVENIVFQSRPGLWVTAHRYLPSKPKRAMPGILICHSHHRPKQQGELQDMGVQWARAGCVVLVPDMPGHGERRAHPFAAAGDFGKPFRVSRQDYHFRYNVGMQLHLIGDGLIGWMVHDLRCCMDLLLRTPGVDKNRIILLGAVAGGGDPAAVTAALDDRIAAVVPFNFGGPQPETQLPLPKDIEEQFNYSGSGSWESTRNLRRSAADGFLHYVIISAVAPRRLVYAHEFEWDQARDPVWRRLNTLWGDYYRRAESLASVKGFGRVTLRPPNASHCTNIGSFHRKQIHPLFKQWFDIDVTDPEFQDRREQRETLCLEGEVGRTVAFTPLHKVAGQVGRERSDTAATRLARMSPEARGDALRKAWTEVLGDVSPYDGKTYPVKVTNHEGYIVERTVLTGERDIQVPFVLLRPPNRERGPKPPVIIAFCRQGQQRMLHARARAIYALVATGHAVCLPDLRGCGETSAGDYRGRRSSATGISSSALMLGQTLIGSQLKDLRTLIAILRKDARLDGRRIALWGDSLADANDSGTRTAVPLGIDEEPRLAEPMGHLLAVLGGLFETDIRAVVGFGGLVSFQSVLDSQFCHIPHDSIVPGAIAIGDIPLAVKAIVPRPVWFTGLVTGENRLAEKQEARPAPDDLVKWFQAALR